MTERDKQILYHIRKNCYKINNYHQRFGDSFEDFSSDDAYHDAVSMCIMQIGELTNGLSDDCKNDIDFPIKEIRGMRNILAHNYIKADTYIIWETSKGDIDKLIQSCDILINKSEKENESNKLTSVENEEITLRKNKSR